MRDGMGALVLRLRRLVDDRNGDVWGDDDLQDTLDAHKRRIHREPLDMELTYTSGTSYVYKIYHSRYQNMEAGGTSYFQVEDASGGQRGTGDYTADYLAGRIEMTADQEGTALYLTGWTYDLNAAAADLWEERAGQVASYYDARTGDHQLSRSQWHKHCQERAEHYRKLSKPVTVRGWSVGLLDD